MSMKLDVDGSNVPFFIDYTVSRGEDETPRTFLTELDIKSWEKTPWWHCSRDNRPDSQKLKYTHLGGLRFCEGWLTEDEFFIAKQFKTWWKLMVKYGEIVPTRNCQGCIGNFWAFARDADPWNFQPGYWVLNGSWIIVWEAGRWNFAMPPPTCQISQFRWNRRWAIQRQVYGFSHPEWDVALPSYAEELMKREDDEYKPKA
jgi:hypothetical protein